MSKSKNDITVTIVELPEDEPCKACGVRGKHFCTGGQPQHGGWIGKKTNRLKGS